MLDTQEDFRYNAELVRKAMTKKSSRTGPFQRAKDGESFAEDVL